MNIVTDRQGISCLELNGSWDVRGERSGETLQGAVPGFVQKDLMEQGRIPGIWDTLFESKIEWIEHDDWTYATSFALTPEMLNRRALELVFEGVDTYAEVWLNGTLIGRTENMFTTYRFDIKPSAREDNKLEVRIASPTATLLEKERAFGDKLSCWNGITARLFGRKAQYGYGWDWGARLVTVGIHKPVRIEAYDELAGVYIRYNQSHLSDQLAVLDVIQTLRSAHGEPVSAAASYRVYDEGGELVEERSRIFELLPGTHAYHAPLEIRRPKRWYPAGYGEQPLYRVEIDVKAADAAIRQEMTIGLRDVKVRQPFDKQGQKFYFEINGVPVLCKGVNWIPLTLFPGLDAKEAYEREVGAIGGANMNMIRVWGGGYYENAGFYEACDRQGIMVWQDFMFACGDYPDDDPFCELVREEVRHVMEQYGHHASIVLWSGNNENMTFLTRSRKHRGQGYGEKLYFEIMPEICAEDSLRPYWPCSPYSLSMELPDGDERYGDAHTWNVWGGLAPYEAYLGNNARFQSEFGMQCYPSMRVMNKVDADAGFHAPQFEAMQKAPNGLQRLYYYVRTDYRFPKRKEDFVYLSQLMQANALRTGMEHWVGRMPDTSGVLIWQWNDLWPSISWSLVDFEKVPKAAFYYSKRLFRSPNVFLKLTEGGKAADVQVIHDAASFRGEWIVEHYDLGADRSRVIAREEVSADAPGVTKTARIDLSDCDPAQSVLIAKLLRDGEAIAENTYLLAKPLGVRFKPANVRVREEWLGDGRRKLVFTTDVYAKDVCLLDVPDMLEDNFFDLRPGESKEIVLNSGGNIAINNVFCLNAVEYTEL